MAERVGAYLLVNARHECRLLDDVEDHNSRDWLTTIVEKHRSLGARCWSAEVHVILNLISSYATNRHKALLIALTHDADITLTEEEIANFERCKLRDAQTTRV